MKAVGSKQRHLDAAVPGSCHWMVVRALECELVLLSWSVSHRAKRKVPTKKEKEIHQRTLSKELKGF